MRSDREAVRFRLNTAVIAPPAETPSTDHFQMAPAVSAPFAATPENGKRQGRDEQAEHGPAYDVAEVVVVDIDHGRTHDGHDNRADRDPAGHRPWPAGPGQ